MSGRRTELPAPTAAESPEIEYAPCATPTAALATVGSADGVEPDPLTGGRLKVNGP